MSHDYVGANDRHQLDDHHLVIDRVHADGGRGSTITEDPDDLYNRIEAFAKHGRGKRDDLARLVESLPDTHKMRVQDLMPDLAKRLSGDEILQVGEIVRERLDFRIDNALKAKPPVSEDHLRRYLRTVDEASIAWLGDNEPILDKVRKLLPGQFGVELPRVADFPSALHA